LRRGIEALSEITRNQSDAARAKLFHDNAVRFYGLPADGKKWHA
jgi:predicted TIM-barrel fold metal-dependent hydrolase